MSFFKRFSPLKEGIKLLANTAILLCAIPLFLMGFLQAMYTSDPTYLTWAMTGMFLYAIYRIVEGDWEEVNWLADAAVFTGLIGTVIGFIVAFTNIDPSKVSDLEYVQSMLGIVLNGIGVAMYTTLIGSITFLWCRLNQFYFNGTEKEIDV